MGKDVLLVKKFAIVKMPWGQIDRASLGISILKKVNESNGFPTDVHYLNLRFSKYVNFEDYNIICDGCQYIGEWIFAQYLFHGNRHDLFNENYKKIMHAIINNPQYDYMSIHIRKMRKAIERMLEEDIPSFLKECTQEIDWNKYYAVGFSCLLGDQLASLLMSKIIKDNYPNIKIIMGGPNVFGSMGREIVRYFEWVDYIVDGEGEKLLPTLLDNLLLGKVDLNIPGIYTKDGGSSADHDNLIDLNCIPVPDYSDYFNQLDLLGIKDKLPEIFLPFECSRGCWWGIKHHCSFCGCNNEYMQYRTKDSNCILDQIKAIHSKYKTTNYYITDNIIDYKAFKTFIPLLIKNNDNIKFFFEVKANFRRDQIFMMRDAGITRVQPGIESLNGNLLKLMNKGSTAIQNIYFLKCCSEAGIVVYWNLLYGIPGEKVEDYKQMGKVLNVLYHLQPPMHLSKIELVRYSPYFKNPQKYGITDIKHNSLLELIYPFAELNYFDLSYSFDFTYENCNLDDYILELIDIYNNWHKKYSSHKAKLCCEITEDAIIIKDSRNSDNEQYEEIVYQYTYISKDIYLYCQDIQSKNQIINYVSDQLGYNMEWIEIKKILDNFIERSIMFCEKDRYLSLAVLTS